MGQAVDELLGEEEVIARGDHAVERGPARDAMVGMHLVRPPWIGAEHEIRFVDADLLADLAAERHRDLGLAVVVTEEDELRRARAAPRLLLLLLADPGDPLGRHLRVVRALVPARDEAVRHVHAALLRPERDRARATEVDVVGMREDRHRASRELECLGHQTSTGCMRSA